MKIKIITISLLISFCVPNVVWAQNKIIILREDGSREGITLDQPQSSEKILKREPKVISIPTQTAADLLKEEVHKSSEVKSKIKTHGSVSKIKIKTLKKKVVTSKKQSLPIPKIKPNKEEIARAKSAKPLIDHIDPRNIPAGTVITQELAVRVALEVSPPARSFDVFGTIYKDRPAYQVRFKTDNGPHDVIIDGDTGAVLKK